MSIKNQYATTILAYGGAACNTHPLIARENQSSAGKTPRTSTASSPWNATRPKLFPLSGEKFRPRSLTLVAERSESATDLPHEGAVVVITTARGDVIGKFARPGALRLLDGKRSFQYVLGQSAEVVRIGVARAANIRDLKGRNDRPAARGEHSAQRYGDRQRKHARRIHPVECPGHPRAPMNEVVPKCRFSPNADVPHVGFTVFGAFMRRRCAKPPVGRAAQRHAQR